MNYALRKLYDEGSFYKYDAFFLITNDSEFEKKNIIKKCLIFLINIKNWQFCLLVQKKWGEKNNT